MPKNIHIKLNHIRTGSMLLNEIASFRPFSSISFQSSEEIISAASELKRLAEWGMAKNKHKMKESVINTMDLILCCEPEEPVNLNLTKYELKSVEALSMLVDRTLNQEKDGALLV